MESTYGVSRHEERLTREARLTSKVREIIARGGRVLMPVVALGRAQVSSASLSLVLPYFPLLSLNLILLL